MAEDSNQIGTRVGNLADELRGAKRSLSERAGDAISNPSLGLGVVVAVVFALVAGAVTIWTRAQPLVAVGRVMDETRLVRREIAATDEAQTQQRREQARLGAPRVYAGDHALLEKVRSDLLNLPVTLAAADSPEDVAPAIREQFGLNFEMLQALRAEVVDGGPSASWASKVETLTASLSRRPILDAQTWQRGVIEGTAATIRLVLDGRSHAQVPRGEAVNIDDREGLDSAMRVLARDAGFMGSSRQLVVNRLTISPRPTYVFDAAATAQNQNSAAETVQPVIVSNPVGQVIFQRGEPLTEAQAALFNREMEAFDGGTPRYTRVLRWGSTFALSGAVTLALAGYTLLFCPRVRRNAARMAGVAGILLGTFLLACATTVWMPGLAALTALAPTLLVTMLIVIGYDRRAALAYSLLHGLLVCLALREGLGAYGVIVAGVGGVVWSLKEIRDRNSLFRTTLLTALTVCLATIAFALLERPISPATLREIGVDAGLAAGGAVVMGAATLFLLPMIERAFNVTTGMTLIELRDPKQPLLRELQQRAPGTYNHSLNVAAIAETAAEAVGADGLLTYVGALYHDIGKMNKPDYFVENQHPGANRHDKLSPAMSLLIVVGHVKDGMELAREFRLPPKLRHFIEAHHGTTLVEYFFHRARKQALATAPKDSLGRPIEEDTVVPDEIEYRYPGPKPRTREAAILMVADAAESAARSMGDPTPGKIDQLVHGIAHKRLLDGQFDDCELTLRELNLIVESVIRTVTSMHHARIAYPGDPGTKPEAPDEQPVVNRTQPGVG